MNRWISLPIAAGFIFSVALTGFARDLTETTKSKTCEIGPIVKTFGMTEWFVYSCDDGHSLAIVSSPNSVAAPFVFTYEYMLDKNEYVLHGEGAAINHDATESAFNELKVLSTADLVALTIGTKTGNPHPTACEQGSIGSVVAAENHARCLFRNISDICSGATGYTQAVSNQAGIWRVVAVPSNEACSAWEVNFRAIDGKLVKFRRVQQKRNLDSPGLPLPSH